MHSSFGRKVSIVFVVSVLSVLTAGLIAARLLSEAVVKVCA